MLDECTNHYETGGTRIHDRGHSSAQAIMIRIHSTSHSVKAMHMEIDEARSDDFFFGGIDDQSSALRDVRGDFKNLSTLHRHIHSSMHMLPRVHDRATFDQQIARLNRTLIRALI